VTLENVIQMYEKNDVVVVSLFPDLKVVSGIHECVHTRARARARTFKLN